MTTYVVISSASDSNPNQQLHVEYEQNGRQVGDTVVLKPGQCWSRWVSSSDKLIITEVQATPA